METAKSDKTLIVQKIVLSAVVHNYAVGPLNNPKAVDGKAVHSLFFVLCNINNTKNSTSY